MVLHPRRKIPGRSLPFRALAHALLGFFVDLEDADPRRSGAAAPRGRYRKTDRKTETDKCNLLACIYI